MRLIAQTVSTSLQSRVGATLATLLLVIAAVLFAACGATHAAATSTKSAAASDSARVCPRPRPTTSSAGPADQIAPDRPTTTTFCIYSGKRLVARKTVRGGPLDQALNSSLTRLPGNVGCASAARLPSVVVLTYRDHRRTVVLDMGGCPTIITSTGARRFLTGRSASTVVNFYTKAARRGHLQ